MLAAIEAGTLPAAALTPARRQLFPRSTRIRRSATAPRRSSRASNPDRAAALAKAKAALALDAARGARTRQVFKQLCATCHRLDREGVTVGPDLFDIRRQPKENIVFHIVAPDAEDRARLHRLHLRDQGRAGLRGHSHLRDADQRDASASRAAIDETVLRADVKSLTALPGSLMPAGLDAAMSPQDFADLLAFLKGEK